MGSWRDAILGEFPPGISRLTLVADPDGLLVEEGVLQGVRERGYDLIPFDDHVAFRYAYESRYRSRWDRGESTDLVVVLRAARDDLSTLPFDLLQAGRQLCFSLGDLFPNLSYSVLTALQHEYLDALYQAQEDHNPGTLGDNATKDFALRHVFEIAPELIRAPSDLLRVLLRRHYRQQRMPVVLDERIIQVLRQRQVFRDWPLEEILPGRPAFLAFLQERWPLFLDSVAAGDIQTREGAPGYGMEFKGPPDLPFDHDDVRSYIDKLFVDGLLRPVPHARAKLLDGKWVSVGVLTDTEESHLRRLQGLVKNVESSLPGPEATHRDWFVFARRWAECRAVLHELGEAPQQTVERVGALRHTVDSAFSSWVDARYHGLHNHPAVPPAMLHRIPPFLASRLSASPGTKIALVVVDGLALDQWVALRTVLSEQLPDARFEEDAVLAWVPTITPVSRQALFAAKLPLYFPESIDRTDREGALWVRFWRDAGLGQSEVTYLRAVGGDDLEKLRDAISHPRLRIVGLVVGKVDRIMHGMELGAAGMHGQVRQWASEGFMSSLLGVLWDSGFSTYLTSDHGNVEAVGCGRPAEGVTADLRGQRARVYSDDGLRAQARARFPGAIEWPPTGLPDDYLPLLAPARRAFVPAGERVVAHGGSSIEELIVPLIHVSRRRS